MSSRRQQMVRAGGSIGRPAVRASATISSQQSTSASSTVGQRSVRASKSISSQQSVSTSRRIGGRRGVSRVLAHGDWITGHNDVLPTCVATAIANSLLAVKGIRVKDSDVLWLHAMLSATEVPIHRGLMAALTYGIGGHYPIGAEAVDSPMIGSLVGINGDHAACYTEFGLVAWGEPLHANGPWQMDGEVWHVDW